jgi:hypothetical protein
MYMTLSPTQAGRLHWYDDTADLQTHVGLLGGHNEIPMSDVAGAP